jgi:hypothetical protein
MLFPGGCAKEGFVWLQYRMKLPVQIMLPDFFRHFRSPFRCPAVGNIRRCSSLIGSILFPVVHF